LVALLYTRALADEETRQRSLRLWEGVGAISFGIGSIATGALLFGSTFQGYAARASLVPAGAIFAAGGILAIVAGVLTLRDADIILDRATSDAKPPINKRMVALACAIGSIAAALVLAWAIGALEWTRTLESGCRRLVTPQEFSAVLGAAVEVHEIYEGRDRCSARLGPMHGRPRAYVEISGDLGADRFERRLAAIARGHTRASIPGLGEEAWRIDIGRVTWLAVRDGDAALFVEVEGRVDHARTIAIMRSRLALIERYGR
jgi:hypothetical protein